MNSSSPVPGTKRDFSDRQKIIDQLSNSNGSYTAPGENPYRLDGIEGVGKYVSDYHTLATGGFIGNLAFTYLGSHSLNYIVKSVDIQNRTAVINYRAHNISSIQSATRLPIIGYQPWYQNSIGRSLDNGFSSGPFSKTEQTIEWAEIIKW